MCFLCFVEHSENPERSAAPYPNTQKSKLWPSVACCFNLYIQCRWYGYKHWAEYLSSFQGRSTNSIWGGVDCWRDWFRRDNSLRNVVRFPKNQTHKQYLARFGPYARLYLVGSTYIHVPSHVLTNRKMPEGITRWRLNREVFCNNPAFAMLNEFFKWSRTFTWYTHLDHVGSWCKMYLRIRFLGKEIHLEKSQDMNEVFWRGRNPNQHMLSECTNE
jgi:hypothetical protein